MVLLRRCWYPYFVHSILYFFFFFQAEDGIRDVAVTGVQTCALPISTLSRCLDLLSLRHFPFSSRLPPSQRPAPLPLSRLSSRLSRGSQRLRFVRKVSLARPASHHRRYRPSSASARSSSLSGHAPSSRRRPRDRPFAARSPAATNSVAARSFLTEPATARRAPPPSSTSRS